MGTQWSTAYCTIADKDGLQSFIRISEWYGLGREDRFRYFQVRDYFNKEIKQTDNMVFQCDQYIYRCVQG